MTKTNDSLIIIIAFQFSFWKFVLLILIVIDIPLSNSKSRVTRFGKRFKAHCVLMGRGKAPRVERVQESISGRGLKTLYLVMTSLGFLYPEFYS